MEKFEEKNAEERREKSRKVEKNEHLKPDHEIQSIKEVGGDIAAAEKDIDQQKQFEQANHIENTKQSLASHKKNIIPPVTGVWAYDQMSEPQIQLMADKGRTTAQKKVVDGPVSGIISFFPTRRQTTLHKYLS